MHALKSFPVKLPRSNEEKDIALKIAGVVDQILDDNKQTHSLMEKIKRFPASYFGNNWSFDKLTNVVKAKGIAKSSYTISEKHLRSDYLRDFAGQDTFRIILVSKEKVSGKERVCTQNAEAQVLWQFKDCFGYYFYYCTSLWSKHSYSSPCWCDSECYRSGAWNTRLFLFNLFVTEILKIIE